MIFVLPLEEGKYTVVYDNGKIEIFRHGEPCRNETGDDFIHALLMSHIKLGFALEEAEERLALIQEQSEYDTFDDDE